MLALHLKFNPESILNQIKGKVFTLAKKDLPEKSLAAAKYHADRKFKSLMLNSKTTLELQDELDQCTRQFNILDVAKNYETNLLESINKQSLEEVLAQYKNKGLLACAAPIFGLNGRNELKDLVIRLLLSKETSTATKFKEVLPPLTIQDIVVCSKETYKENQLLPSQLL